MADRSEFNITPVLPWASGAMFVLIGFVALLVASRAGGEPLYWIGLGVFVLATLAVFFLISKAADFTD
jgi:hypothetical protein